MNGTSAIPSIPSADLPALAQALHEMELDARAAADHERQMGELYGGAGTWERAHREAAGLKHERRAAWLREIREFVAPGVAVGARRPLVSAEQDAEARR